MSESEHEEQGETSGVRRVIPPTISVKAALMRAETHPWLRWPGCDGNEKIVLNNRLAELQDRPICQPRFMDWDVINRLGLTEELDEMFLTHDVDRAHPIEIPIWNRALNVKENVYREWCLEFYSSLRVEKKFKLHEIYRAKLISFRLGGKEHNVTVPKFGFLTGLLTEAESKNRSEILSYLASGALDSRDFLPDVDNVWFQLSGLPAHNSQSKISALRIPILRVVHKLLTYSFVHRATQHDKVYAEDLWLLHMFNKGDPEKYVNVPWVLACFMESKGAGRQHDSQICCGHFVTRIARTLQLFTPANVRMCSPAVNWRAITLHDLQSSKLVNPSGTGLIDPGVAPAPPQPRPPRGNQDAMLNEVMRIGRGMDRMELKMDGMVSHYNYHMERYQPYLEQVASHYASSSGAAWNPYAPPQMYAPPNEEEEGDDDE